MRSNSEISNRLGIQLFPRCICLENESNICFSPQGSEPDGAIEESHHSEELEQPPDKKAKFQDDSETEQIHQHLDDDLAAEGGNVDNIVPGNANGNVDADEFPDRVPDNLRPRIIRWAISNGLFCHLKTKLKTKFPNTFLNMHLTSRNSIELFHSSKCFSPSSVASCKIIVQIEMNNAKSQ